jgi:hypothetical protein
MLVLRLIVFFLLCYVAFTALKGILRRGKDDLSGKLKSDPAGEDMVLDPQCHSYVPKSNAVAQAGRYFCSRECAQLYLSR